MDVEVADRPVLRVVVADDQPVVRAGLTAVLGGTGEMEVVASSPDGREAVRDTLVHRPDVLVLDLRLRELSGEAVIRDVLLHAPRTGVLVFSAVANDESLRTALRAGARGYLPKNSPDGQIVRAVERIAAGESVFGQDAAVRAIDMSPFEEYPFPELTTREREVLALMADGLPNPAIARELHLAQKTVSNHISNIYAKLRLADRYQVIVRARAAGLGSTTAD
jgi:DNA-binding NarL/FixJ family response regulator